MLGETVFVAVANSLVLLSSSVVALYVKSVKSELLVEMEKTKSEIIKHINTSYVRKESCVLREGAMQGILDRLRHDIDRDAKNRGVNNDA